MHEDEALKMRKCDACAEPLQDFGGSCRLMSDMYGGKDLMFKDSTKKLIRIPEISDSFLYLGAENMKIVRSLQKGQR
ncbi:serotransferrin-1 [Amia ocellicauda]|uniref:serotransferrin-1 n=1 Tax=Amia ocellicauda TaxID=2972642 RepID=UPI003464D93A